MNDGTTPRTFLLRVTLMTCASIVNSVVITCFLTWATLGWPGEGYYSSYSIWRCALICGFAVPALIGPVIVWRLVSLVNSLNAAQQRLQRLATTDELTGLLNRRGFDPLAERAFAEAKAAGRPISVLACDIDRFKAINDGFGHQAGDLVLRRVGDLLREGFAKTEAIACRHGGEEFVVVLPGHSAAQAANLADGFRAACAADKEAGGGLPTAFTISIGVAEHGPSDASLRDLLRHADAALYDAKQGGRNRVESYVETRLRLVANA